MKKIVILIFVFIYSINGWYGFDVDYTFPDGIYVVSVKDSDNREVYNSKFLKN
jgi:hypothetical protein